MIAQTSMTDVLIAGAREVFEKMIFMQIAEFKESGSQLTGDVMLGSISFRNGMDGCMSICCTAQCARTIAINMLAMSPDDPISEDEIKDALGEVTNMVMGSVKTAVQSELQHLQVSIPVVVTGRNLQNSLGEGTQRASVFVTTENNDVIELTLLYRESRGKN
jgi:chemotaxis protein CheX